ncbi:hypothetical protein K7640_00810 [Micromonospora sp. PLK6-60]|uniref:hypothetical protein n=1 Tax=Micromonospora sp. PLK6-60 TaxID=2873383 RepID=UPI001CA76503|nr:hypothetical protein [Micromonospora sp. PLK6-60]MBY8870382.1 hypothetical protein [Micromonospora sp. PLK6-60]
MPLQRNDARPVPRPPGLVPPPAPLAGVTELRLHGVGGTTPESLLADDAPQLVSGDRVAGFYRTADTRGRHVEAYSWGGLTSRSASRVLWLLLLPFALVNVAGWMCMPAAWRRPWRFLVHRAVVRWAALGLTVNLLLLVAMTSMDVLAYQCGGRPDCRDRWWLRWLGAPVFAEHPARRVLVGAALPLLVALGLKVLSGRSLARYEQVPPPQVGRTGRPPCDVTPARPGAGLADPDFWNGGRGVAALASVHLGTGLAFVGWLTGHTVRSLPGATRPGLATAVTVVAALAASAAVVLATRSRVPAPAAHAVVALGALAVAGAVVLALTQPAYAPTAAGPLPGMRGGINWAYGCCLAATLSVLLSFAVNGHRRGRFRIAGPFVVTILATVILNAVGIGTMIRVADLLGRVPNPGVGAGGGDRLFVYGIVYALTPYLTLLPFAILLGFALVEAVTLALAGTPARRRAVHDGYATGPPAAGPAGPWDASALDPDASPPRSLRGGWTARIARARRLAALPHDADLPLTLMAATALLVAGYVLVTVWARHQLPWAPRWALTVSTWLAAAAPLAVLLLMRQGWRGLASRRHLGVLWDVATFWPRAYHPLAPPSYAERAVPDVQRRLWRLHDHGGGAVVVAHSQGSVLAVAALLQESGRPHRDGRPTDRVALVTFGSPVTKLYGWAFPAYFGPDALGADRPRTWRWRNFWYPTDYIGGPVLADSAGVDEALTDPPTCWYVYGQDPPVLGRHSGYWGDGRVWAVVDRYAGELPLPDGRMSGSDHPDPPIG